MKTEQTLDCDIAAPRLGTARALAAIVSTCAQDVGVAIATQPHAPRKHVGPAVITLHMPVECAANQNPAWCLACRLACFCPDARVSVLVRSETAFKRAQRKSETRRSA